MKRLHSSEHGLGHLALLTVVVVLTIVGLAGYVVVHNSDLENGSTGTVQTSSTSVPSVLKTKADVTTAAKALDSINVDSSVNPNQLDSDLNSLL